MKSKKNLIIIITLVILIGLIGITYAFFDYYKLGTNQKIVEAGKVNLLYNEGTNAINLTNFFPESIEKARSRTDNYITFTISGTNTTLDNDIYYEIMLNEGDVETGMTRFEPKDLVFDLVELDENGNEITYLVDALSFVDFNERSILVDTIERETSLTVNKTYKLRMWLSDKVIISDTNPLANYPATGYEKYYASVKVSVYGDFVKKPISHNYMAKLGTSSLTFWPSEIDSVKAKITSVEFILLNHDEIDTRYDNASIKADVTDTSKGGSVKVWLENDELVTADDGTETQYYTMYVASTGTTFFPSDSSKMFYYFSKLKSVSFENVNTKNVTNMSYMFYYCSFLTTLDASNWNTSYVTTMYLMFYGCSNLTSLDVSNWNTSSVTSMSSMFSNCKSLTSLDLSSFDTSSVTTMVAMFDTCYRLTTLDVSNFDTSSVTSMSFMFSNCRSLTSLDLSSFDTSSVTSMSYMFSDCKSLTSLDLSSFDTSSVTNMSIMFYFCSKLTTLDVSNWNTSSVTNMSNMFGYCSKLITLDVSNFDTSSVTDMSSMFYDCSKLTTLDVSNFDTSSVTDMDDMFYSCDNLITIYSNTNWNTGKITSSSNMFLGCTKLVGAISYNSSSVDVTYANPTTGYFTKKTA